MANNIIRRKWNQNALVSIEDLSGSVFQAESGGHTFEISGVDNFGNAVALSGTVAGVFMRSDNTDVAITGTASGGVVTITLPAECYDVPGRFGLTVFVTADSKKTAVYAAIGTVRRTSSGNVAPGTTADVVDLINAINAAVTNIPQSWSGLMADIAPTYSASAVYPVGAYVYYDGDLYRCTTAITTAESWTAGHWTAAVLGQDVSDLKSAVDDINGVLNGENLFSTSQITSSTSGVSYTTDDDSVTVNATGSNTYQSAKDDEIISLLMPGKQYRLKATAEIVTGNPALRIAVRGVNGNADGIAVSLALTDGGTEYVDFTATEYMAYLSFFSAFSTGTKGSSVKYSDISVVELNKTLNDINERIDDLDNDIETLGTEIETIKETIGGGATAINTTEESPTAGYWSKLARDVLNRVDGSTTYYTLANPIDISSLKDGTTFTIKSSVTGNYGAYVADANMIVVDYVNGSNAEDKGYNITSDLQDIAFVKTASMKYVVSDIRTTKYTSMSDFSVHGTSDNDLVLLDKRVTALEDSVFPDKDTYPTQTIIKDGGFCKIFQTIGVVGDSLSSGSMAPPSDSQLSEDEEDTTDYIWYSWIQYMARYSGLTAYNFSMGGLSARGLRYATTNPNVQAILANLRSNDKKCKAYYVALAHNDYNYAQDHPEYVVGTSADCNLVTPESNANTFYGNYAWVVSQIKAVQPNAKIFLITAKRQAVYGAYNSAIRDMVGLFNTYYNNSNVYLVDMETYCPTIETDWEYSGGHGNAMGYLNYSYQVSSYTDWIIRHNRSDFKYVQFIGTGVL